MCGLNDIDFNKIEEDIYNEIGVNKDSFNDDSLEKAGLLINEIFEVSDDTYMKLKETYWEYLENTKEERDKEEEDIKKQIAAELGLEYNEFSQKTSVVDNSDNKQKQELLFEESLVLDNADNEQKEELLVLDNSNNENELFLEKPLVLDNSNNEQKQELLLEEPLLLVNSRSKQKKEFSEYIKNSKIEREKKIKDIQKYFAHEREFARKAYNKQNSSFYDKYLNKGELLFSSQYAPMIICEISKQDILYLNKLECVTSISLYKDIEIIDEGNLEFSLPSIEAIYTRDTLNLRGNGIKIGQIEEYVTPDDVPDLNYDNITIREGSTPRYFHAPIVAATIVGSRGMVPDAELYCTAGMSKSDIFYDNIEWLIKQNVNVINMSAGVKEPDGTYDDLCKWVDHIVNQYSISFVKSAGNEGNDGFITSPGVAYNAITVGAIDDGETPDNKDDDKLYDLSSCLTYGNAPNKPDVMAPGVGISILGPYHAVTLDGTSYSAAHTTGMIAQLMQAFPLLLDKPHALKALVMASCDRKTKDADESMDSLTTKEGAGVINVKRAVELSSVFFENSMEDGKNFEEVTSLQVLSGSSVTIVLTWFKKNTAEDIKSGTVTSPDLSKFNFIIEDNITGEKWYPSDNSSENNVKYILFKPLQTGTYTIYVQRLTNTTSTDRYALSCVGEFSIPEDIKIPTILSVKPDEVNNKVTVNFIGPQQGSAVLIAASYSGIKQINLKTATISQNGSQKMDLNLNLNGADRIKIMMWNSLTGMRPLCGTKEVLKINGQWIY